MKITYKGDYALKTILSLALHYGSGPLAIHQIAEGADIPLKFLEQILLDLKRGGFVESKRGKVGGYILARQPAQITIGDVVKYIDGPLEPVACVDEKYQGCQDIKKCVFQDIWKQVTAATSMIIDRLTFEDLSKKVRRSECSLDYQI